ncbi:MAG: histidine kinase [Flavobacterium sp.]|uniref:hybrid sensor histidine kinase/response regulator n=1 Tax=Flavobacterium sp. TaxID=239 RepID=UPI000C4BA12B|nr:transporter substrate-binding domain-containing protein [Flavobacterium sp.]MBF02689.1 histidine kinase [Flavobacterium sp.]|tara:strand:- start:84 stop:2150 length:2067 start_codon:yes stop_codon:yes gene_type:complete
MKLLKIISLFITILLLLWATSCSDTSFLSSKEKKYLAKHDSIKVAVFPYYPPYQFTNDQGEMDGIFVDFLELIEQKIDYKFQRVYYTDWEKVLNDAKTNKVDMILEIQQTKEKESFLVFYPPLFESKHAIVQRKDAPLITNLKQFGKDQKLILPYQYSIVEIIQKKYPNITIGFGKDELECLQKVNSGEYDAYIGPKAVIKYLITKNNLKQVRISTELPFSYSPGFAVAKNDTDLQNIIKKSLNSISNSEKKLIIDNWLFNVVTPFYEKPNFWIWVTISIVFLLIIIILINRYLKFKIKQRTRQLRIAKEKAEESDRLKTNFIQNISHEIRTPMNGIIGFSELLQKENLTLEEQREFAKIIAKNSKELIVSIDNILEIAKLQTEKITIKPEEIDLDALFETIYKKYQHKAKEKNIHFVVESQLDKEAEHVLIDKPKLFKILLNLIDNAIKFTKAGSIIIEYTVEADSIIIKIKDSGIGIKKKDQETIFNIFTQSEKEISKNYGGLGLGLSIAKKNADLIGGKISFETLEGQGTTFTVILPFIPISKTHLKTAEKQIPLKEKPEKHIILIAEDGDVNFLFLKTVLTKMPEFNFVIHRAENGRKAVDICEENTQIELVLMDIKMPIMDGYEATQKIKKIRPKLPVIAQTAYSTEEDIKKAIEAGCDDFISKPIDKNVLKPILSRFIFKTT